MDQLFEKTQVAALEDVKPIRLTVEGLSPDEQVWLTTIRGTTSPNFQLMYAIGPDTFINSFNQKLTLFSIKGIYVTSDCGGAFTVIGEPPFLSFYRRNNINSSVDAIKITFNGIVITGFLVKLDIGEFSKEGIEGHLFTLDFLGVIGGFEGEVQKRLSLQGSSVGFSQDISFSLSTVAEARARTKAKASEAQDATSQAFRGNVFNLREKDPVKLSTTTTEELNNDISFNNLLGAAYDTTPPEPVTEEIDIPDIIEIPEPFDISADATTFADQQLGL